MTDVLMERRCSAGTCTCFVPTAECCVSQPPPVAFGWRRWAAVPECCTQPQPVAFPARHNSAAGGQAVREWLHPATACCISPLLHLAPVALSCRRLASSMWMWQWVGSWSCHAQVSCNLHSSLLLAVTVMRILVLAGCWSAAARSRQLHLARPGLGLQLQPGQHTGAY